MLSERDQVVHHGHAGDLARDRLDPPRRRPIRYLAGDIDGAASGDHLHLSCRGGRVAANRVADGAGELIIADQFAVHLEDTRH